MAEIGSLSVEFTRLSQLTGEDRYYDAIAQITDELEKMQTETKMPGLWPKMIDASGCKKPATSSAPIAHSLSNGPNEDDNSLDETPADTVESAASASAAAAAAAATTTTTTTNGAGVPAADKDLSGQYKGRIKGWDDPRDSDGSSKSSSAQESQSRQSERLSPPEGSNDKVKVKRQLALDSLDQSLQHAPEKHEPDESVVVKNPSPEKVDCQPQGLASPPGSMRETFTFGGMADSTYEYLPKQFMLLGGLVTQYQKMYEKAIDAANKHLIFRPMIPDENRNILVLGSMDATEGLGGAINLTHTPEQSHLTCFAGAMWGIGGKIFGREADLAIASKLTDGCVWAYESTKSGIMPEGMTMIPCASRDSCAWNKTRWYEELDPYREMREQNQRQMKQAELLREAEDTRESKMLPAAESSTVAPSVTSTQLDDMPTSGPIAKRQLGSIEKDAEHAKPVVEEDEKPLVKPEMPVIENPKATLKNIGDEEAEEIVEEPVPYNPYPTHEEYVESRLKSEKLPTGVPAMYRREYILRYRVYVMFHSKQKN